MSSKPTQKFAATFYTQEKKKQPKTPPKVETALRKGRIDNKKKIAENQIFQDITLHQKDERFKYLLKHGQLKKIQKNGNIIFAELQQIPGVWVCYRRPCERESNVDRLNLDSLELVHIPLLEGEQKLKMLTFQHNQIAKIQNLISLPNLIYIDFFDNQIKQIENLSNGVPTLKVLLLPKNSITKIKNINELVKLQVLDLHNNKIAKMQGFGVLNSLRILNLSHNQIVRIQNIDNLINLTELNLKNNLIVTVEGIKNLGKLQKLYLSNNRIEIKSFDSCQLVKVTSLRELSLENNPCSKQKIPYFRSVMKHLSFIKLLDGKTPTLMQEQDSSEEDNHAQVLKLIASQWQQQKKRIQSIQLSNGSKRQYLKTTLITGGHAEIEDESILFIYGNSYEVVLSDANFQQTVEKIRFEYVFIEFIIEQNMLNTLKKFRKLKIIQFSQNYIISLLQIAKLENLVNLKTLCIQNKGNPIAACTFLKQFIIYRFPSIVQINREDVKQADRNKAKLLFQNFDKALQIPQKAFGPESLRNYPCQQPNSKKDRNYLKNFNKIINEESEEYVLLVGEKAESSISIKSEAQKLFDDAILLLIKKAQDKIE